MTGMPQIRIVDIGDRGDHHSTVPQTERLLEASTWTDRTATLRAERTANRVEV